MIYLRKAQETDLPLILAWRSSPFVYQGFYLQKEPLMWCEHIAWFGSRNRDWRTFIIEYQDRGIGIVAIGQLDHWSPEIGYYIGEVSLWGQGLGKQAVRAGLSWLKEYGKEYCHATVLKDNNRSLGLLKSLGFKKVAEARRGEIWLQISLGAP